MSIDFPMSTGQAAAQLGVTPRTVNNWCKAAMAGEESPIHPDECFRAGRDIKVFSRAVERIRSRGAKPVVNETASKAAEPDPRYSA